MPATSRALLLTVLGRVQLGFETRASLPFSKALTLYSTTPHIPVVSLVRTIYLLQDVLIDVQYTISSVLNQWIHKAIPEEIVIEKWFIENLPGTSKKHFYEIEVAITFISLIKTISLLQDVLIDVQ
jgi:hypothetical protein